MCSRKECIRYVFLFVCANGIIESQAKKQDKTYHGTVPGNFCPPCLSCINFKNLSCSQMRSKINGTVIDLRRHYENSESLIKESLKQMYKKQKRRKRPRVEELRLPSSDHPIDITDFESDSKIKRMIRHKSLNEKELPVHLAYSRISILASYLQLVSDIIVDIPHIKAESYKEKLLGAIDNLRKSSCRHYDLLEKLHLKSLSKRVCNFTKRVSADSKTHRNQYVVSVLKYGKKHMRQLIEDLPHFRSTMESCEILPTGDKDLSTKSSSGDKKEPRSMVRSKDRKKRRRHRNRNKCRNLKKKNKRRNKKKHNKKCRKGRRRNRNKSRKSKQ